MQATITYLLSEQAQRAQMAATGQPVPRKLAVTEELPMEYINHPLVHVSDDGQLSVDLTRAIGLSDNGDCRWNSTYAYEAVVYPQFDAVPESGIEALRQTIARVEDKAAEMRDKHTTRQAEVAARDARESVARTEANRIAAEREAAEAARERAKSEFIAAWIADRDEEFADLKQQFAEGLLCRSVALSMIADAAFAAAGIPAEATYDDDFCRNQDCPCGQKVLDCLPTKTYSAWRMLKEGLPQGYAVEFIRVRECLRKSLEEGSITPDEFEAGADPAYFAKVKMPHGPFTLERTVKLR